MQIHVVSSTNYTLGFVQNKLSLNAGKTKYIVIRPKYKKCNLDNVIQSINGIPLQIIGDFTSNQYIIAKAQQMHNTKMTAFHHTSTS